MPCPGSRGRCHVNYTGRLPWSNRLLPALPLFPLQLQQQSHGVTHIRTSGPGARHRRAKRRAAAGSFCARCSHVESAVAEVVVTTVGAGGVQYDISGQDRTGASAASAAAMSADAVAGAAAAAAMGSCPAPRDGGGPRMRRPRYSCTATWPMACGVYGSACTAEEHSFHRSWQETPICCVCVCDTVCAVASSCSPNMHDCDVSPPSPVFNPLAPGGAPASTYC